MTATAFTVLYIEDNAANRQLLEFIFARKPQLTLALANDGTSGITQAKTLMPDLILLDVSLPDTNGYLVLQELRSYAPTSEIPVVMVSGDVPNPPSEISVRPDKYLRKPIELDPLFRTLEELLDTAL